MIRFESGELAKIMQGAKALVDKEGAQPILGCAYLAVSGGNLTLRVTNLSILVEGVIGCEGECDPVCVPIWLLRSCSEGGARDVVMSVQVGSISARVGNARFEAKTLPASDFPWFGPESPSVASLDGKELARLLTFALPAVDEGVVYPQLEGVNLSWADRRITATATDTHVIMSSEAEAAGDAPTVTVPTSAAKLIASYAKSEEATVALEVSSNCLAVSGQGWRVVTLLIGQAFIDWRRFVRARSDNLIRIDRKEGKKLASTIRSAVMGSQLNKGEDDAHVAVHGDCLVIGRGGLACDAIAAASEGEPSPFAMKLSNLVLALDAFKAETVEIDAKSAVDSVLITSPSAPGSLALVMPYRSFAPAPEWTAPVKGRG